MLIHCHLVDTYWTYLLVWFTSVFPQAKAADHAAPRQNQGKRVTGAAGPPEPERALWRLVCAQNQGACKYNAFLISDYGVKDVTSRHASLFLLRRAHRTALHRVYTAPRLHCAARTESWRADWPQPSSRSSTSKSFSSRTHRNTLRTSRSWRRRSAVIWTSQTYCGERACVNKTHRACCCREGIDNWWVGGGMLLVQSRKNCYTLMLIRFL